MYKPLFSWFVKVLYVNDNGIGDLCYYIRTCPEFRKWFWSLVLKTGENNHTSSPTWKNWGISLTFVCFAVTEFKFWYTNSKHFWKFCNVSEQYEFGVIKVSSSIFWATILIVVCPGKFASNPWFTKNGVKHVWLLYDVLNANMAKGRNLSHWLNSVFTKNRRSLLRALTLASAIPFASGWYAATGAARIPKILQSLGNSPWT